MNHAVETAFLPAAIEIERTPPSPAGRTLLWSILLFFIATLVWAWFGHADIVAIASGRLIPSGHTKTVQPAVMGTVATVHVQDGQQVRTGEALLDLDTSAIEADLIRLEAELAQSLTDGERAERLLSWLESGDKPISAGPLAMAEWQAHSARIDVLERERQRRQVEMRRAKQQVAKLSDLLPIATRRAEDRKRLAAQKLISEQEYLETEQQRLIGFHDLAAQRDQVTELEAASEELLARIALARKEYRHKLRVRQNEARLRVVSLEQEIAKSSARLADHRLVSPVEGIVQQLVVRNPGAVVTPAQQLMVIVPSNQTLEVEAYVENKDIGFVEVGQRVEVKVEAFPFTRHGTLHGRIADLSSDAIADEQRGWIYKMRILLENDQLIAQGRPVLLSPGMTVTAETKTGSRRLIEFFLSPLLRYRDESIRER